MICEEIMKRELQTIDEASSIQHAAEKMATANVGFLPVCDRNGQALGTITDRDITVRAVARGKAPGSTSVGEVMSREVIVLPGRRRSRRPPSSGWCSTTSRASWSPTRAGG